MKNKLHYTVLYPMAMAMAGYIAIILIKYKLNLF